MATKVEFQATFEPRHVIRPIYTGGSVALSQDGSVLATCLGEDAVLSNLTTGEHLARVPGDGDIITTLALSPDASCLVVCSRTLSMRIYALNPSDTLQGKLDARLVRTLKPHAAPVVVSSIDSTSTLLATGGADGVVKVWDLRRGFSTHTLHGHSGVVSALHFFQVDVDASAEQKSTSRKRKSRDQDADMLDESSVATAGYRLASGGEDGKVRVWDLHKRKSIAVLDSHVSVVRSLSYSPARQCLASASRDKTVILWDARSWQQANTIPVLEGIESAGFVGDGEYLYTGGESARLRVWTLQGQEVTHDQPEGLETEAILHVISHEGLDFLLTVHADQTLLMHSIAPLSGSVESLPELPVIRRISGTHDEVIDMAYIGLDNSLMALATNSEDIRLINMRTVQTGDEAAPYFGADVFLLRGHDDIIITMDTDWSGHWLATGAKDNTARLWRLDPAESSYTCYSTFTGHAESISAVALPSQIPAEGTPARSRPLDHPPAFLITGSQDKTVKKWDISPATSAGRSVKAAYTRKAHDKEMNAIDVSHTSTMFASASQDRTVKIWDVESGESIGVLRGHKRGVWTVAFAPPSTPALSGDEGGSSGGRGLIVTGSGDKTVRIWSLSDYSCLRTFEGHSNSVLKTIWLPASQDPSSARRGPAGPRVASAAGDGLVKVWDAQEGECAATLDNHIDRVWALAAKPQRSPPSSPAQQLLQLASGSADSTITFWADTTAATARATAVRATARLEQDQELRNHVLARNHREAITLALALNHPKRLLELFTAVGAEAAAGTLTGDAGVDQVVRELGDEQLWKLLLRVRDWNANARTAGVAQRVLNAVFKLHSKERLVALRRKRRAVAESEEEGEQGGGKSGKGENLRDLLDGLKAYTDRHLARVEKMAEERFVLLWTLQMMDDTAVGV